MNGPRCGLGEGKREEEDPNLNAEEPWVSRDKGGASPDGASNWSDSSVAQNKAGTSVNDGRGTTSSKYTDARSGVDPKVSSSTNQLTVPK